MSNQKINLSPVGQHNYIIKSKNVVTNSVTSVTKKQQDKFTISGIRYF